MDDAADDPAVVDPRLAARVRGKMRSDLRKLRIRKPELVKNHRRFLSEAVNHNRLMPPSTLWVYALEQAMPDLVPFARSRREVMNLDRYRV
jgi:hypothetical protein